MQVTIYSSFWYPTEAGGCLVATDQATTRADFTLRVEHPGSEEGFQTALLAADLAIADCDGRIWKGTSYVTADIFLKHLVDFSSTDGTSVFAVRDGLSGYLEWDEAFRDRPLVSRVLCLEDDRFYRTLLLDNWGEPDATGRRSFRVLQFKFHYSTFLFDIAAICWKANGPAELRKLAVRVNDGPAWEYVCDSNHDPLGSFGFVMDWRYLMTNSAYLADGRRWIGGDLPMPLVFRGTDERTEPQPHVRTTPWAAPSRTSVQGR